MDLSEITDEEYFAELKLMFNTTGWAIFSAELLDNVRDINDLQAVTDVNDLHYRKGKLDTIGLMLNFPETIRRAEEDSNASTE